MKIFWILMAVIGLAAALVLSGAFKSSGERAASQSDIRPVSPERGDRPAAGSSGAPSGAQGMARDPVAAVAPTGSPSAPAGAPTEVAPRPGQADAPRQAVAGAAAQAEIPTNESAPTGRPGPQVAARPPLISGGPIAPMSSISLPPPPGHEHQEPQVPQPVDPDVGVELDALLGLAPESPQEAEAHAARIRAAHEQALSDLAERYGVVGGEGTKDRPYRIDWERLAAASRVYRPREGLLELPAFIQQLDGAYVEIAGYTLFSWSGLMIDEILLTRYMWDGCCIGVPPTPFTAVETRLKEPLERKDIWAMRSGIFVGRFIVDPYVQGEWLIALYVLEDAEMQPVF